jgi:ATP-binding cassette, subfamily C (CFTR/MRP), member 4
MAYIGCLGVLVICLSFARSMASFYLCIKASRHLHDKMTLAVLRSKVQFFDTNPVGRILNRFSADIGTSDDQIPSSVNDTLSMGFIVLGGVATAATVMPFLLIALPPIVWYFLHIRSNFVKSSRELKRIEGMARSPIFAMMSESVAGIATIRSNGLVDYCTTKFETIQDAHSRAFFAFMSTTRWLNFRLESITVALLALACFLAVLFNEQGWFNVDPSILGLALTLLLQLSGLLQWFTRQSSELINQMVAIERMSMYADLPSEAPLDLPEDKVLIKWPGQGRLDVSDLSVRYRTNLPPALSGLTFHVESGQRLGIVGRTGSGKSTFIQALFRLLEAETGGMELDGVRIDKVGLHKLRTSMSVIPQTPVLFSGCSIRENLDPFSQYDDDVISASLSEVQLTDVVTRLPNGLDTIVAEGGSNFSVGQRQLLCVARAILQKTKMIILDEPTANVDTTTDVLLQRAIATSFPGATVIAVAHRLDTIIDYDKILVFGNGELLEFGSPHELLENGEHFRSMVDETGDATANELRTRAAEHASRLAETNIPVVVTNTPV